MFTFGKRGNLIIQGSLFSDALLVQMGVLHTNEVMIILRMEKIQSQVEFFIKETW